MQRTTDSGLHTFVPYIVPFQSLCQMPTPQSVKFTSAKPGRDSASLWYALLAIEKGWELDPSIKESC